MDFEEKLDKRVKELEEKLKKTSENMRKAKENGNDEQYERESSNHTKLTEEIRSLQKTKEAFEKINRQIKDKQKQLNSISNRMKNARKDGKNDGKSIFNIDGIADAFSDFSTFDRNIMKLNVGYRTASCNCGGQEDFNDNIIKFYGFLSDFYNEDLKDEYDEDEDEE